MQMRLTANQVFIAAIAIAILVFYTVFRVYYKQLREEKASVVLMTSAQELLYHTEKISAIATAVETGSRAFFLTGQQQFSDTYSKAKSELPNEISILRTLTADNGFQQEQLDSLVKHIDRRIFFADSLLALKDHINTQTALQIVATGSGKAYMENVYRITSRMQEDEKTILELRKSENERQAKVENQIFLSVAFLMLALLLALFWKERKSIVRKEREKTQRELQFLNMQINQANDSIFIVDAALKIKSWNKGAENLYGYTKEEVMNKNPNDVLQTSLTEKEIDEAVEYLAQKDYWTGEFERTRKDGKQIIVHSSTTVIRNEKGTVTGYVAVSFDITAQKQLQEQVKHLANMVEESSEAIFSRGTDRRMLSWNKGAETLFGFKKEEVLNRNMPDIGFVKLEPGKIAAVEKQINETGTWKSEMNFFHKNGSSFFGLVTGNSIVNEKGEVSAYYFIVKDISTRKKLEEQLKQSNEILEEKVKERTKEVIKNEKRFRTLIENNNDIITLMDESFKVFYRSPSAERITGWSDEEMFASDGKNKMAIHPDDWAKADEVMKECLANPGKPIFGLYRNQHKNGHYLWLEGSVTNLLHDPNLNAVLFNFRDVSERIAAEEKIASSEVLFRSLIENSVEGISLLDEHSNVIYRSPSAYKIIGNNPTQNTISFAHPDYADHFKNCFAETLSKPSIPVPYKIKYQHPDGYHFWAEGTFTNLLHVKGVNAVVANYHDITDKVLAQEKIESSEKRFRALVEKSKDIITLMDASFNVTYRSPSTERITGWSNEEMINNSGAKNIHPDDKEYFNGIISQIMAQPDKAIAVSFRSRHKDGHYLWLEGTLANLLQQEYVKAIVFNARDVTERIEAEEKLKASEEQFRHSMDNMLEGVQIHDFNWRYLYVNNALVKNSTYTKEELLGYTLMEKYPGIEQSSLFEKLDRCMKQRVQEHFETEFAFPNGTVANFELSVQPIPEGIFILSIDITERKKAEEKLKASEEQFRNSMDNMLEGVQIIDFDWRYIYVNNSMAKHGKYTKEELIGSTVMERYPGIEKTEIYKVYQRCFNERVAIHLENEFIFPDGDVAWFELSFLPVPEGIFILSIDITERKKAEDRIKKMNIELEKRVQKRTAELKKANEELEAFSYSVSHDLRAPLRAIVGFSAILEEEYSSKLDDEAKRITGVIRSNTVKMGSLIDDLLTFSRMGRHELVKNNVNSSAMVKEIINGMQSNDTTRVEWVIHPMKDILADVNMIRQVWINLISNAVKYSGNSPHPKIQLGSFEHENKTVFFIEDNGVGFDQKYENKLFKVFQRLHGSDEFEGTGIGLAIVEKIIAKHGGTVWAEAELNKGASFYFSLPNN